MGRVSVIVSAYSRERYNELLECIGSLKEQSLPPDEIILVLDPDEELTNFYASRVPRDVTIVVSKQRGLSNARNTGVRMASGDIVAFIDDDAVADRDWLRNLAKNYDDPQALGAGGLTKPVWKDGRPSWFPEELDWVVGCSYKGLPEKKSLIRNPIGCNMSFRRDVFERVGYFASDIGRLAKKLLAGEEAEFSIRIAKAILNSKIVYDPSAVVYHNVNKERARLSYLLKRSFFEGVSKALLNDTADVLSTEHHYLRYLLEVAIPLRLKRIHKFKNVCQLITLLLSTCAALVGFLFCNCRVAIGL